MAVRPNADASELRTDSPTLASVFQTILGFPVASSGKD